MGLSDLFKRLRLLTAGPSSAEYAQLMSSPGTDLPWYVNTSKYANDALDPGPSGAGLMWDYQRSRSNRSDIGPYYGTHSPNRLFESFPSNSPARPSILSAGKATEQRGNVLADMVSSGLKAVNAFGTDNAKGGKLASMFSKLKNLA